MSNKQSKILVVFANPRGSQPLRLGEEDRAIKEAIRRSRYRDNVKIEIIHAATTHDLRRALLDDDYRIVQISGHGTGNGLLLEDETGAKYIVPQKALANLLAAYGQPSGSLECVILNACYSLTQGKLTSLGVSNTIAMQGPISDNAAIEFSRGFYDAIGAGRDIKFAYDEGCRTVELVASNSQFMSKFLNKGEEFIANDAIINEQSNSLLREASEVKALIGLAVDVSGSMASSIRNDSGGQLSRLESFRRSVDRLVNEARLKVRDADQQNIKTSLDVFAYGFGLRGLQVCDLLSLMQVGKHVITKQEIEDLKDEYARQMKSQYSGYGGLADLARSYGLGGLVNQAERTLRANAEAEIRQKIMLEVKRRIERQLVDIGDTTLPIEDVASLWDSSGETLGNAEELIFGNTPMTEAMNLILARFQRELENRSEKTQPILFIVSDGEPTDGDPMPAIKGLQELGVTIVSCYVTDRDFANPRVLYGEADPMWDHGTKLMFKAATHVGDESEYARFLLDKGWTINQSAKLFVQINHSTILEEFIRVILSPLEDRNTVKALPRGI